jgi:putative ABC transport system ATP-binding protein
MSRRRADDAAPAAGHDRYHDSGEPTADRPRGARGQGLRRRRYGRACTRRRDRLIPARRADRRRIGFVFQSFNLIPTLSAEENITLPLALAGAKPDRAWLDTVVDAVGLAGRLAHRPSELSGGQQQRVAVARALASQPEIVFADEPTGNLDSRAGTDLLEFLRRAVDDLGQSIIMVTHDPMAASYADAVVLLADGRIVDRLQRPSASQVLDRTTTAG